MSRFAFTLCLSLFVVLALSALLSPNPSPIARLAGYALGGAVAFGLAWAAEGVEGRVRMWREGR
jgi:hypothetical protein